MSAETRTWPQGCGGITASQERAPSPSPSWKVLSAHDLALVPIAPPQTPRAGVFPTFPAPCHPTGLFLLVTIATVIELMLDPGLVRTWLREAHWIMTRALCGVVISPVLRKRKLETQRG